MLALVVQLRRTHLPPRQTVSERVVLECLQVRAARRGRDYLRVVVGGRLHPSEQRGHEEPSEVEVPDDVRAPL